MRVQLPKPSVKSGEEEPAVCGPRPGSAEKQPDDVPTAGKRGRRRKRGDKWLRNVTRWQSVLPLFLVCVAGLAWSLLSRPPKVGGALGVQARAADPGPPNQPVITAERLADLRAQAAEASAALVQRPDEIGPLLYEVERGARELGWRIDLSLEPALPEPGGVSDVTLHPVRVKLEDDGDQADPAYARMLSWLRLVSSLPKRVEVAALDLQSAGAGLGKADVQLSLFSVITHEKAASQ